MSGTDNYLQTVGCIDYNLYCVCDGVFDLQQRLWELLRDSDLEPEELKLPSFSKWYLPILVEAAYSTSLNSDNITSGFRASGLWPFDPDWCVKNAQLLIGDKWLAKNPQLRFAFIAAIY